MRTAILLCALLGVAATAGAEGIPIDEGGTPAQIRASLDVFRKNFKSDSVKDRIRALVELDELDHAEVVEEVGKTALVDESPEVRDVAAQLLGRKVKFPELAGKLLAKHLGKNEGHHEVQISILRSIGRLGYKGARKELLAAGRHFLEKEYNEVTIEVIRAFGTLGDTKALPFLLELAEYRGKTLRGRGGPRVRAANDAEARRIWWKKYGHNVNPAGTPEVIERTWMQQLEETVLKLTGQTFEDGAAFRKWLTEHLSEMGLTKRDLPKEPEE